jgi:hypothetical protein
MDYLTKLRNYIGDKLNQGGQAVQQVIQQAPQFGSQLINQVESLPQQAQAVGGLLNQGVHDQSLLPQPINNYLANRADYIQRTAPIQFNPVQFSPQNIGQMIDQSSRNVMGLRSGQVAPDLPPFMGGGFEGMAEQSLAPLAEQMLLKGQAGLQGVKIAVPEFNSLLGQAGKVRLGPTPIEEPFQGIKTSSTLEDLNGINGRSPGVRYINGGNSQPLVTPQIPQEDPFIASLKQPQTPIEAPVTTDPFLSSLKQEPMAPPVETGNQQFADWANSRRAIGAEKQIVGRDFGDFKNMGFDPIHQLQAGESSPRLNGVRAHLDARFKRVAELDPTIAYQKNYAPQMWNNSPEGLNKHLVV